MGIRVTGLVAVVACLGLGAVDVAAQSAVAVAAGNAHTCAVTSAGSVWCWGANWAGQLGDGTSTSRLTPVPVSPRLPPLDVTALAAGDGHTCAVTRAGAVWCWGDNRAGQLGDGTTTTRPTPVAVSGLGGSVVVAITAGWGHTCAVTSAGAALCWGSNADGQLGDGTTIDRYTPVVVSGLGSGTTAIAAAPSHTCAVTDAGTVSCWGSNGAGQLGDGTTTAALTPVTVQYLSGAAAVTAGHLHSCAATSTGAVWCWGSGGAGQLGDGTRTDALTPVSVSGLGSGVVDLTSGDVHTCALTSAGAVWCWGSGLLGDGSTGWHLTPSAVRGLGSGVTAFGAAMFHTCAVTSAGAVTCWGWNDAGQLGDGTSTSQLTPAAVSGLASGGAGVSAGGWNTCAVTTTGAVRCWGSNDVGQVGDGTTTWRVTPVAVSGLGSGVAAVSTSGRHACAMTGTGALWCWGNNWWGQLGDGTTTSRPTPVAVSGLGSGAIAIVAGSMHTCAVTGGGAVKCWGNNDTGQLGDGTTTRRFTPVAVSGLESGAVAVTAGYGHTCALTNAGAVWCWGSNWAGQLGDDTTVDRLTPVAVSGLGSGAAAIAAGSDHTCAATTSGSVLCWGYNGYGQLGDGTNTSALTPVAVSGLGGGVAVLAAGSAANCAVTGAGTAWCWGSGNAGQLGNGSQEWSSVPVRVSAVGSGVATIATGGDHTCAVAASGAVLCWGLNVSGLPGDDQPLIRLMPVMVSGFAGPVPTVSSVAPPRGAAVGGTAVTITGTGFGAPATVTIGGVAAANVVVAGATSITATTPPGAAGPAAVSVTTSGGTASLAGGFTYVPAPTVTGVHPAAGPTAGGTAVRITGTGFASGATVTIGGAGATNVVVVSATSIMATTPPHAAGQAPVVVTNPDGQAFALSGAFTFVLPRIAVDVDGDGRSDILWRHTARGEVWLWPMVGPVLTAEIQLRTVADSAWEIRGLGDQTEDGHADILWRNRTTGMVYLWPMRGSTVGSESYLATVQPEYDIAGTGDYNGDGTSDILWRHLTNGELWVWLMNGTTVVSATYVDTIDPGYGVVGSGDLNGDTKADIVWRHQTVGDVWVWLMDGATPTAMTYVTTVGELGYQIVGVADHTGDGKADILWHHNTRGEVWLWPMNGTTLVSQTYVDAAPDTGYRIVGSGDYDGDGKADILWHNATRGDVWVWPMDGTVKASETYVATVPDVGYRIVRAK